MNVLSKMSIYLVPRSTHLRRVNEQNELAKLIKLRLMKYTRSRRLVNKCGLLLQMLPTGDISATRDTFTFLDLQVISIGANMIAFWGRESEKYLAVNEKGEVYASQQECRDCVFIEKFTPTYFNTYETYHTVNKSIKRYLTLQSNGKVTTSAHASRDSMFYWEVPSSRRDSLAVYENL